MSEQINVLPMAPHEYAVTVTEGTITTRHRVTVPEDFAVDLGLYGVDEEQLVEESFAALLEHEPATSLYEEFPLDVALERFPDLGDELRARFAS